MSAKNFSLLTAVIFLLIFILHGLRLIYGWEAVIGTFAVPIWLSWLALIISGILAYQGFKLSKK